MDNSLTFHRSHRFLLTWVALAFAVTCWLNWRSSAAETDDVVIYTVSENKVYQHFYVTKKQLDSLEPWVPGKGARTPPLNDHVETALALCRKKHGEKVELFVDQVELFNLVHSASGATEFMGKLGKAGKWGVRVQVCVREKDSEEVVVFETVVVLLNGVVARSAPATSLIPQPRYGGLLVMSKKPAMTRLEWTVQF